MLLAAHQLLGRMAIVETRVVLSEALALAERMGLKFYDASYHWLAQQLQAELVTLDNELAAAAGRGG